MSVHTHFVFRLLAKLLTLAACTTAVCSAAQAANNVRYISITGNNANPCTLAAPCRSLQRAINLTPAGGELRILDSGFYGNKAQIRKSMTITGNGNTVFRGTSLTINRDGTVVTLRDLTLNGQGTFSVGIVVAAAATVHVEHCVVHGFNNEGIFLNSPGAEAYIVDSISRDNGGDGLRVATGGTAVISNSTFVGNLHGIHNFGTVETRANNTVRGNDNGNLLGDPLTPFDGV